MEMQNLRSGSGKHIPNSVIGSSLHKNEREDNGVYFGKIYNMFSSNWFYWTDIYIGQVVIVISLVSLL